MKNKKNKKNEALSVVRLINEVLVQQLNIPFRQIVNDTTFSEYTGAKRPDLLISEFAYEKNEEKRYIENLLAYAEVKDNCTYDDKDWKDAVNQGKLKAPKLKMPYFIVTNCQATYFYNSKTMKQLLLNGNPIREFQTIDIYRLIKNQLLKNPLSNNITTNVDSKSTISEAIFNKKLLDLANLYRDVGFKNNIQKIDFTVGLVALEYFEEKEEIEGKKDNSKVYWSTCNDSIAEKVKNNLIGYIDRLNQSTEFNEFKNVMDVVKELIGGNNEGKSLLDVTKIKEIYNIVDSMKPLHGTGFDLFGAVYEMFASPKEKKDFGEYFTRRHYAHIFTKLLLKNEKYYDQDKKITILDPACGTGGFLTESFKVLMNNYESSGTLTTEAKQFLSKECFYGIDVRPENISRTRLNMFLVGDGHTHMYCENTLLPNKKEDNIFETETEIKNKFNYIITNPPYGIGKIKAETTAISSTRMEVAFLYKIISLLKIGGKACIIIPDGIFENPSYKNLRNDILEKCTINSVISLPKFAFAPYTKEKTYALFLEKRSDKKTKIQSSDIWMYIIDNDGLANSDKRFPTKLRDEKKGWLHDEISGWVNQNGEEEVGLLEKRWLNFDDSKTLTVWIDENGEEKKERKGGNIKISTILEDKYLTLLPEYYLRPYQPNYIDEESLIKELDNINSLLKNIFEE